MLNLVTSQIRLQGLMSVDYSHIIVGAGVVGLAIGARLSRIGLKCLLVEKNSVVGSETSSRNSEVIHAGLYYPENSLKMRLCLRGKELIYSAKELRSFTKNCGKWIIAQTSEEAKYLEKLKSMAANTGVPLNYIPLERAHQQESSIIAREAILESPSTGIISSHALMQYYESLMESSINAGSIDLALLTEVERIEPVGSHFEVEMSSLGEKVAVKTSRVINSAGLWAPKIAAMVGLKYTAYYAKGNYFSYPSSSPRISRLIYPCPSNMGSLGTHLTIDLNGGIKFGPDFEWVDGPSDYEVSSKNLAAAKKAVERYIKIDTEKMVPDYSGIRPKLSTDTSTFQDFHIKEEIPGFFNLMNIESPGLTSSMAIAEYVESMQ